jgi:hypothetical protein
LAGCSRGDEEARHQQARAGARPLGEGHTQAPEPRGD